jgi:outer membrane receptor protein involved in Fe transport
VQFDSGGVINNASYAAFGQMTYKITDSLSLTGGLRYTDEDRVFNPGLQHIVGLRRQPRHRRAGLDQFGERRLRAGRNPYVSGWRLSQEEQRGHPDGYGEHAVRA